MKLAAKSIARTTLIAIAPVALCACMTQSELKARWYLQDDSRDGSQDEKWYLAITNSGTKNAEIEWIKFNEYPNNSNEKSADNANIKTSENVGLFSVKDFQKFTLYPERLLIIEMTTTYKCIVPAIVKVKLERYKHARPVRIEGLPGLLGEQVKDCKPVPKLPPP